MLEMMAIVPSKAPSPQLSTADKLEIKMDLSGLVDSRRYTPAAAAMKGI
jgi:hypothetical protein